MPVPDNHRWAAEVQEGSHNPPASFGLVTGLGCERLEDVWVLSSASWHLLDTSTAVWEAADAAVELVNRSLALSSYGLLSVTLGSSLWERREDRQLRHTRAIVGTAEILLDPLGAGGDQRRPLGDRIAALAARDQHFASAMAVFTQAGLDLPALWVAFEHAEAHAGGENELRRLGWITRKRHRPFAETVDRVRHYRPGLPPPQHALSPRQCRAYIRDLLARWLDEEEPA